MPKWQQFPLCFPSPPSILCFFTLEPFTFPPVTQLPSYVYLCVLRICVFPCTPQGCERPCSGAYVNTCLFDISFPLSAALKARICLRSAKPRRERCVGAHRLSHPVNNTPSECLELYTTRISSSLSVVSDPLCLSFFHCMSLDTEMDRQILGRQRQKLGCFLPEGLELQPGCQCVLGREKKKLLFFCSYFIL